MEKDYTVYLTKSHEVSGLISRVHAIGKESVVAVCSGAVDGDTDFVPEIYHGKGYFYCAVTRESQKPGYRLEIA